MKKLGLVCLLTLTTLVSGFSHSASAMTVSKTIMAETILKPFQKVQVFSGEFEQHKKLPVFSSALISNGRFISVRDHGLVWETLTPAPSILVMTPGRLVQIMNGRKQAFQASGTDYDGIAILLPALLDGDMKALESYFSVTVEGSPSNWSFELQPDSKELSSIIEQVTVTGGDGQLDEINLSGPDGDHTRILFKSVTMNSEAPDAADLAHFD